MRPPILLDTGPLVAYFNKRDQYHRWALQQFGALSLPFLTCEAVLTEAAYLLGSTGGDAGEILDLLDAGALQVVFEMEAEAATLRAMMDRYRNVPMDLADACLMRMGEDYPDCRVLTTDSDFFVYRTRNGDALDVIAPS